MSEAETLTDGLDDTEALTQEHIEALSRQRLERQVFEMKRHAAFTEANRSAGKVNVAPIAETESSPARAPVTPASRAPADSLLRIAAITGPVIAIVALAAAWSGQSRTDLLRTDVASALELIDDHLSATENATASLDTRLIDLNGEIESTKAALGALGITELRAKADQLQREISAHSSALAAASETDARVDDVYGDMDMLRSSLEAMQRSIDELPTTPIHVSMGPAEGSKAQQPTASHSAQQTVTSIEGATLSQVDHWGGEPSAVLVDERHNLFSLSLGSQIGDWEVSAISYVDQSVEFRRGDERRLLQRKTGG